MIRFSCDDKVSILMVMEWYRLESTVLASQVKWKV